MAQSKNYWIYSGTKQPMVSPLTHTYITCSNCGGRVYIGSIFCTISRFTIIDSITGEVFYRTCPYCGKKMRKYVVIPDLDIDEETKIVLRKHKYLV